MVYMACEKAELKQGGSKILNGRSEPRFSLAHARSG